LRRLSCHAIQRYYDDIAIWKLLYIVCMAFDGTAKLLLRFSSRWKTSLKQLQSSQRRYLKNSSSSYPYPTKWRQYNMFSICYDKDSAFIFLRPAACLTSTLETGVDANDCKCSRDQHLNVPSEARRSSK
jgi:hypothetical protein